MPRTKATRYFNISLLHIPYTFKRNHFAT